MYQVIQIYGENEPWWFFDDWEEDIVSEENFESFEMAEQAFMTLYDTFENEYAELKCKNPYLVAFWNPEELIYCEDCDEDLQAYRGLMLLKNKNKLNIGENSSDETVDYSRKAKCCSRLSKGARSKQ